MRNQVFTVADAPKEIAVFAESRRALFVTGGVHTIYDGHVRLAKEGQIQAQEVLATGSARLTLYGHIICKLFGEAFAKAGNRLTGSQAHVELRHASSLEIIGGTVEMYDQSRVDALTSRIFVFKGTPTIHAHGCLIIIVDPEARPVIHGSDTQVLYCPGAEETTPRALPVAQEARA